MRLSLTVVFVATLVAYSPEAGSAPSDRLPETPSSMRSAASANPEPVARSSNGSETLAGEYRMAGVDGQEINFPHGTDADAGEYKRDVEGAEPEAIKKYEEE